MRLFIIGNSAGSEIIFHTYYFLPFYDKVIFAFTHVLNIVQSAMNK